jgi:hypothetical protein
MRWNPPFTIREDLSRYAWNPVALIVSSGSVSPVTGRLKKPVLSVEALIFPYVTDALAIPTFAPYG